MKFIEKHYRIILMLIPLISLALHFHVFRLDLIGIHVWRQTETQTVINNFYTGDFNIHNPRINDHADTSQLHRMEFPLMQWFIALLYKLFGASITITRLVIFSIGIFSTLGIYRFASAVFNSKGIGALCAWCFSWSPVFYYYTVNPMPDNLALCFGIWCIVFFSRWIGTDKLSQLIFSGLFLCLATMAKLPFIIYGSFVFAYALLILFTKAKPYSALLKIIVTYALCLLPALSWYVNVMPTWEIGAVRGVFDQQYNHPDLVGVITGTLISVLPELLVNYAGMAFFLYSFFAIFKHRTYRHPHFLLFLAWGITIIAYFLFEMNIIDLVHDYYLLPFLPPIFLMVGYGASRLLSQNRPVIIFALCCLAIMPLTAFIRADSRWDEKDPGFNVAYYKYKNELRTIIPKDALCVVGNDDSHYILLYYIDRKGWAYEKDWLDEQQLAYYISKGGQYFFTDSKLDELPEIRKHLDQKIFDKETLRVYKLK